MSQRQPRTYPFLGFFLANLLTNVVLAKLAPLSGSHHLDDSERWHDTHEDYHHNYYPSNAYWKPIQDPYTHSTPPLHTTVSLTTSQPPPAQQQIVNINGYVPDYVNDYYQDENTNNQEINTKFSDAKGIIQGESFITNKGNDAYGELLASSSNVYSNRLKPAKLYVKRATYTPKYSNRRASQNRIVTVRYKRYKNGQKRKRYTTPSYYDSYEELTTTRYRPRKRVRPSRRTTTEAYDYYEESFEATTRPYRRRRPSKNKNKRRPVYEDDDYNYDSTNEYDDITETITLRPRQELPTTTLQTDATTLPTTTSTMMTTTNATNMPSNTTANTTTLYGPGMGNDNISITYTRPGNDYLYPTFTGYGPSNGNENISITYGPPTRLEYAAPYIAWYAQQSRTNDVVRRVHDIVGFDNDVFNRRLT